ncbi:hypothetical protein L3073_06805 [Ancylomarina sp. DW003]|nr:hypothetical protein [Ancylomarina sp. DW003]
MHKKYSNEYDFDIVSFSNSVDNESCYNNIKLINTRQTILSRFAIYVIFVYVWKLFSFIVKAKKYDYCHIQYVNWFYVVIMPFLKRKSNKIILTFWGSDFMRKPKEGPLRRIAKYSDIITVTNPVVTEDLARIILVNKNDIQAFPYGLIILDSIDSIEEDHINHFKRKFGIPHSAIIVTCGTNDSSSQQHNYIIKAVNKIKENSDVELFFLFPMTYRADMDYLEKIKGLLRNSDLNHLLLEGFLSNQDLACLRRSSDILIQIQKNDLLSGAMLEHLYANNIVVTGNWLPYSCLYEKGVQMLKIDNVNELESVITQGLELLKENKRNEVNRDVVKSMFSWDDNLSNWKNLYN